MRIDAPADAMTPGEAIVGHGGTPPGFMQVRCGFLIDSRYPVLNTWYLACGNVGPSAGLMLANVSPASGFVPSAATGYAYQPRADGFRVQRAQRCRRHDRQRCRSALPHV